MNGKYWGAAACLLVISLFFAPGPAAALSMDDYDIVRITYRDLDELNALASLGMDIWSVDPDTHSVVAYISHLDRELISAVGFRADMLIDDVAAHIAELEASFPRADAEYHTNDQMLAELEALAQADVAELFDVGDSVEGRDIWALKISDNPGQEEGEPEILFTGCHHAREWISVEVPYYIAKYLVDNYGIDPEVTEMVDSTVLWVIPIVNPDGYEYTWGPNRLWRKNRRNNGGSYGVDLNRNYGFSWGGPGSSGIPSSETYRGTEPFSEPETRAVRDLVEAGNFKTILSYHSYSQLILHQWGHTYDDCKGEANQQATAETMADLIKDVHGKTYQPGAGHDLYLVSGDTGDWFFGTFGLPAFTVELRPVSQIPGFVLPATQIIPTYEENLPAALHLLKSIYVDGDGDGVVDIEDNCPEASNGGQDDGDDDGIGDDCDNCVDDYNPAQEDRDDDGIGSACDDDEPSVVCFVRATGL